MQAKRTDFSRQISELTSSWDRRRLALATRAIGIGIEPSPRESLDVIAADEEVSRETVRRARNDLLRTLDEAGVEWVSELGLPIPKRGEASSKGSETAARALRRMLTMTGPLPWDEVIAGWERARGRTPFEPLPSDFASFRAWVERAEGFVFTDLDGRPKIGVVQPEDLDQVGSFLVGQLGGRGGVDRQALLDAADRFQLRPTTIATTLSQHPAVTRVGRGLWALRGAHVATEPKVILRSRALRRSRPTTFAWSDDGRLVIEFSAPHGPSPVIAVPRAIVDLIEGRSFDIEGEAKHARITIGGGKLWGFGSVVVGLAAGDRVQLSIDLLSGGAKLHQPEQRKS